MDLHELSEAMKAIATPARLRILELLRFHPYCVRALTVRLGISQPAVSQHLAVLKRVGLVDAQRRGAMVHYRVDWERFAHIVDALAGVGGVAGREDDGDRAESLEWPSSGGSVDRDAPGHRGCGGRGSKRLPALDDRERVHRRKRRGGEV